MLIQDFAREDRASFRDLRRRIGRLVTSNYDISDRCNLRCEGCLFFAGDDYKQYRGGRAEEEWRALFAAERARGVNFGYFAGGEPSLEIERLRIAHEHIARGVVFSNGLIRIPDDISYNIHVSIWGDDAESVALRGAGVGKAIRNYARDPRATFVYTISTTNIDGIHEVARLLAESGAALTFNLFSPTTKYLDAQCRIDGEDEKYFRLRDHDNPILSDADLARAGAQIERARDAFGDTILYSTHFHDWLTRSGGLYELDPSGIATNCGNRLSERHRHYNADLSATSAKCCSPNLDCSQCRAYAQSYATFLTEHATPRGAGSPDWLEVWNIWARLFLGSRSDEAGRAALDIGAGLRSAERQG